MTNNMLDEIIFRDGVTLDRGTDDITEYFLSNVGHICDLGRGFGLKLDRFEIDDEELFETYGDQTEWISDQPVKVVKAIRINNVWEEMMKYEEHYDLISYDHSEEYWKTVRGGKDGYLKRKTERINKVREACSK